jgi:branched-chain amino acid transport system ATP-binding protein
MLEVRGLEAGYGSATVLFDVSLDVADGEAVALLGRNGAGKSTTLKAIAGWLTPSRGDIRFDGRRIDGAPSYRIARAGLGFVPEGRRIFSGLTVAQNLEVGRRNACSCCFPPSPNCATGAAARFREASSRCWRLLAR